MRLSVEKKHYTTSRIPDGMRLSVDLVTSTIVLGVPPIGGSRVIDIRGYEDFFISIGRPETINTTRSLASAITWLHLPARSR